MSRILIVLLVLSSSLSNAALKPLASPKGQVHFQITTNAGQLMYSVSQRGRSRLAPAHLGITVGGMDLGKGSEVTGMTSNSVYTVFPWRGAKQWATNDCTSYQVELKTAKGGNWRLDARVFEDGAAFRYVVPGVGSRRVEGEATSWQVPAGSVLWFQTGTHDYEGSYQSAPADNIPLEEVVNNRKQAVHIGPPATLAYANGGFGLITEAALFGYSGLTLRPVGKGQLKAAFQDDPQGWMSEGEIRSPWRVVVLSDDLHGLVNSDVIASLCEPPDPAIFPKGAHMEWLRPGKAPCTWMVYGNDGAQWDRQKWFVDVAAASGCEYLLVDAGWRSEKWGWMKKDGKLWERAAELCRYGAERNVGIFLWHAFPEGRDDSPGLTTAEQREELFRKCAEAGVKGVKIDFINSESKAVVDAYEDLLRRAANHRLMVNFHGANKPTGEMRTWPNEITREGLREQEYVLWGTLPLAHYGALPFTRMAAGHGDFLPGYVQKRFLKNTTAIFQMASVIVFSSPFLCWPDNPEAYLDSPLATFVRNVPVTWDETRVLAGSEIGRVVIMARRNGAAWYVAALNCQESATQLEIDLTPLLSAGAELTTYIDGAEATLQIAAHTPVPENKKLRVSLTPGGGFLAELKTRKVFPGWK